MARKKKDRPLPLELKLEWDDELRTRLHKRIRKVWNLYQEKLREGVDEATAEQRAAEEGLKGDSGGDNPQQAIRMWRRLGKWPPSDDILTEDSR